MTATSSYPPTNTKAQYIDAEAATRSAAQAPSCALFMDLGRL